MKKRKIMSLEQRTKYVQQFLKIGQTQLAWCEAQGIAASTFSKWISEYKRHTESTKFVMLTSASEEKPQKKSRSCNAEATNYPVLIEIGACKIHASDEMALAFMLKALKEWKIEDV